MTEKTMVKLGKFFPPLWLLGAGALGAVLLCLYLGAGVWETEKTRAVLEADLKRYQPLLNEVKLVEHQLNNLKPQLAKARAEKEALEKTLKDLSDQETAARKIIAQRDQAERERDAAREMLAQLQKDQQNALKEKEQSMRNSNYSAQKSSSLVC